MHIQARTRTLTCTHKHTQTFKCIIWPIPCYESYKLPTHVDTLTGMCIPIHIWSPTQRARASTYECTRKGTCARTHTWTNTDTLTHIHTGRQVHTCVDTQCNKCAHPHAKIPTRTHKHKHTRTRTYTYTNTSEYKCNTYKRARTQLEHARTCTSAYTWALIETHMCTHTC